jgi:outer membrane protein, heavy metal efflux system
MARIARRNRARAPACIAWLLWIGAVCGRRPIRGVGDLRMIKDALLFAAAIMLAGGCASGPPRDALPAVIAPPGAVTQLGASTSKPSPPIRQVEYAEPVPLEPVQPLGIVHSPGDQAESVMPQPVPLAAGLTMQALEQMAIANSPVIAQAAARVRALRGKWVQVGLPVNPTTGYLAGEIDNGDSAGQHGGFVGQDFITAGKLRKNRAVVAAEILRADGQRAIAERRVRTDLRRCYYAALLAQRRVELAEELVRVTSKAVAASKQLVEAEEIPLAGLLQTEVQQQNAQIHLRTSHNGLAQAWRRLSVVVGGPELSDQPLVGDVSQLPELLDWDSQLVRLQSESPEVATAMANVERARRALRRACVEAVPDITAQVSVQYDDSTDDTFGAVQLGMPLPIWNRNQGGIRQAQAEITEAVRNVNRVERDLNQRLADAFRRYSDAYVTAESYASDILPRSQRTFELVGRGYEQGEVGYLDLLTAQHTFSQTNLAYLDSLGALWQSYMNIEGLLLNDSFAAQP